MLRIGFTPAYWDRLFKAHLTSLPPAVLQMLARACTGDPGAFGEWAAILESPLSPPPPQAGPADAASKRTPQ